MTNNNNKNNPPAPCLLFSSTCTENNKKSYHNQECWNKYSWHMDKNQEKSCISSLKSSSIQKSFNAPC